MGSESGSEINFRPDPDMKPDPKLLIRIRDTTGKKTKNKILRKTINQRFMEDQNFLQQKKKMPRLYTVNTGMFNTRGKPLCAYILQPWK
jgi:hypothetical protein